MLLYVQTAKQRVALLNSINQPNPDKTNEFPFLSPLGRERQPFKQWGNVKKFCFGSNDDER